MNRKPHSGTDDSSAACHEGRVGWKRICKTPPNDCKLKKLNTSLLKAACNDDAELVKELLDIGACTNVKDKYGQTPLHSAVQNGNIEVAKLLLDFGANVNAADNIYFYTPLQVAVNDSTLAIVELLLNRGSDTNVADRSGRTPLHDAAFWGDVEVVEVLLSKGASIYARCFKGRTLLHKAVSTNGLDVCQLLLNAGIDVNAADGKRETALHIAAGGCDEEIVEMLLNNGACIDAKNSLGQTPLHMAVIENNFSSAELLLHRAADVNAEDEDGNTPLSLAVTRNSLHIGTVLEQGVIMLKAAGLFLSSKNLQAIKKTDEATTFQVKCEEEVGRMKVKIFNGGSFFDLLRKNANQLAIYAGNENIVRIVKSDDFETEFPIYAPMMENRLDMGINRKKSLDQGFMIFDCPSDLRVLPLACAENILSFLSYADLKICYDAACN